MLAAAGAVVGAVIGSKTKAAKVTESAAVGPPQLLADRQELVQGASGISGNVGTGDSWRVEHGNFGDNLSGCN